MTTPANDCFCETVEKQKIFCWHCNDFMRGSVRPACASHNVPMYRQCGNCARGVHFDAATKNLVAYDDFRDGAMQKIAHNTDTLLKIVDAAK